MGTGRTMMKQINTHTNRRDAMTRASPHRLFYHYMDHIMGHQYIPGAHQDSQENGGGGL